MNDSDKIFLLNCIVYNQHPVGYNDIINVLEDFFEIGDLGLYLINEDNVEKVGLLRGLSETPNEKKLYLNYIKLMEKLLGWIPERTEIAIIDAVRDGKVRIRSEPEIAWKQREYNLQYN